MDRSTRQAGDRFEEKEREDCLKIIEFQGLGQLRDWLAFPILSQVRRGDWVRLAMSKYFQIGQIADTLFALNGLAIRKGVDYQFEEDIASLQSKPPRTAERLNSMFLAVDHASEIAEALGLMRDAVTLIGEKYPELRLRCREILEFERKYSKRRRPSKTGSELLHMAREVALAYHRVWPDWAICLSGSVAKGYSDAESDVDLLAYCETIPSADLGRNVILQMLPEAKDFTRDLTHPRWSCDAFMRGGCWTHVDFKNMPEVEEIVQRLPDFRWDDDDYLEDVQCCVILFDPEGRVAGWKKVIDNPPPALRSKRVGEYLKDSKWFDRLKEAVDSGHFITSYYYLMDGIYTLCNVIFALNGIFSVFPKWVKQTAEELRTKPTGFYPRLVRIVNTEFSPATWHEKVIDLLRLWGDTLDVVRKECPDINLHGVRLETGI